MSNVDKAKQMMELAAALFPINRSLTGDGVRASLRLIKEFIPQLEVFETDSETQVGDWIVPKEWNVVQAYIEDLSTGMRIVDFAINNLHLVGYSVPIDAIMDINELDKHLHSLPEQPDAIPYVTSYYSETWGFCLTHNQRTSLGQGPYRVLVDTKLSRGSMTFGEIVLPGAEEKEVLLSTYLCHPSMANNEISGPVLWTFLFLYLQEKQERRYTYRFYIGPETIGAINYLHFRSEELGNIFAGWVLTCIGDSGPFSYLKSRFESSISDRVGVSVVQSMGENHKIYSFLDRGSDERQFCSPGVDMPIGSFMRSKYGVYPEYHTSLDNLSLFSEESLIDSLEMMKLAVEVLESNEKPKLSTIGEPFMSQHGLYPTTSTKSSGKEIRNLMNVLAYMDGHNDLMDICCLTGVKISWLLQTLKQLKRLGIVV